MKTPNQGRPSRRHGLAKGASGRKQGSAAIRPPIGEPRIAVVSGGSGGSAAPAWNREHNTRLYG